MTSNLNREKWLIEFTAMAGQDIFTPAGIELPPVHISVGYPTASDNSKVAGACHNRASSEDGVNQIFITPTIADSLEIASTVIHELIHAVLDCEGGHGPLFKAIADKVGITAPLPSSGMTDALTVQCQDIIDVLGPIPHSALKSGKKKQGTRQLKVSCSSCGAIMRMSKKYQDHIDYTSHCPCCAAAGTLTCE